MRSDPNWQSATLGDIVDFRSGKALPDDLRDAHGHYPVMGANGEYGRSARPLEEASIITIGRVGASYGAVHRTHGPAWVSDNALIARPGSDNDFLFVYYLLQTCDFRSVVSGSSQPLLTQRAIASIPVAIPPPQQQIRIAATLGALDDKIDSKRRTIKSLEALIGEMFNERFFGLVGSKPQWDRGVLSDLVRQHKERCSASELTASLPYVPIDLIASRSFMLENQRPGDEARSSLTKFEPGDILFGAMRPYFHKVALAPFRGVTRTTVFVLRPINERDWAFVSLLLSQPDTIEFATRTSRGSTIPYAAWDGILSEMPVDLPPPAERAAFDDVARPALTFIQNSCFELGTLAKIRDALLPKLISGEIRVSDTHDPEELIGPVAEGLAAATP